MRFERLRDHATESERADLTLVGIECIDEQTALHCDADARCQTLFQRRLDRQQCESRREQRNPLQRQARAVTDAAEQPDERRPARDPETELKQVRQQQRGALPGRESSSAGGRMLRLERPSEKQRPREPSLSSQGVGDALRLASEWRRQRRDGCICGICRRRDQTSGEICGGDSHTTPARRQSHGAATRRRYDE